MSRIDIEALLQPLSETAPCGDNLEYDPLYQELERIAQGKPETQFSDAEPPDWKQVKAKALELLGRSHDLRALVHLTHASLHVDGWPEFSDCLVLMQRLLEQHWDHVHPQLDPDDGDPTLRVNAIVALCHPEGTLGTVRHVPLVRSRLAGQFNLRDIEIAHGKLNVNLPEEEMPKLAAITAAFMDCDLDTLQADAAATIAAADATAGIETVLTERLGASQAPDLSDLVTELRNAHKVLAEQLRARGVKPADEESAPEETEMATETATAGSGPAPTPVRGEITSREDIVMMLDKICAYYARHEPSSPVPLLLRRAKRLVSMDFMDILRDMAPDAVGPVQALRGKADESGE
jgi:type VI secretion system protein ImpA